MKCDVCWNCHKKGEKRAALKKNSGLATCSRDYKLWVPKWAKGSSMEERTQYLSRGRQWGVGPQDAGSKEKGRPA